MIQPLADVVEYLSKIRMPDHQAKEYIIVTYSIRNNTIRSLLHESKSIERR